MNNREDVLLEMIQDCSSISELCSTILRENGNTDYWDKTKLTRKIGFMLLTLEKLHKEDLIDDQYLLEIATRGDG